jgi:pimeloyl-ACP methyl ester carboxylesterase
MAGEADHVVAANEQSRRLHHDIAGSRLEIVPKVGHMIHYAARGRIGRAVDALMR